MTRPMGGQFNPPARRTQRHPLDCSNILESLLQPNQFKRLGVEGAKKHPWFSKDTTLRDRLPHHRLDIKRKFEPEVIEIMAERLNQPKERIRMHLVAGGKYDKISAMFYIIQDALMKEVLYPPNDLKNSFIYKLQCRRKSHSKTYKYDSEEGCMDSKLTKQNSKISDSQCSKGFNARGSTYLSHYFERGNNDKSKLSGTRSTKESRNITNIRSRIGDGEPDDSEIKVARRNNHRASSCISKTQKDSSIEKDMSTIQHSNTTYNVSDPPFRSYRSNRPTREKKEPSTRKAEQAAPRHTGDIVSHSGADEYLEINDKKSDFLNCSVNMNNPNDVKLLNEKFYNMCRITQPQNTKNNLYDTEYGTFSRQRKTDTPVLNQMQFKKYVPGLLNINQHSTEFFKSQRKTLLRPNTTQSLMRPSSVNAIQNNKSSQRLPNTLSQNSMPNQQPRQRSMIYRRTNTAPSTNESNNKIPINKFQYGAPVAYIQNPIYGMGTKKSSIGSKKYYNSSFNSR
ncbi:hormonally up-regulated neu tumor-associated kinase [Nephila pilipes]|uniref:Hormonally up-regulated neu tumor-associated kinase n=1 Tax=Nephila pilipes TaxID=299642 RepID=A0A8X6P793_NEPPI|nr:hormonally up-regulated neu tumor-associated kinase [Nephila pilipes]